MKLNRFYRQQIQKISHKDTFLSLSFQENRRGQSKNG